MSNIKALSVLDGRYSRLVEELNDNFSEYGLIKHRVFVEIQWLKFIIKELKLATLKESDFDAIDSIARGFNAESAMMVKEEEKTTNHDVKAAEYYIKKQLDNLHLSHIREWVHFSCTSEDINNTSYALMLKKGISTSLKYLEEMLVIVENYGKAYKSHPLMARTHGQPATPTTVGKEFINFAWRIRKEIVAIKGVAVEAKMNGAVGNYNAHHFVYPEIDWVLAGEKFIREYLGVTPLLFTTQINPYSYISELLHAFVRVSSIIIDLDRDMWGYISLGYFKQKLKEGEVGSSTMPHKVNPIDFENSEGNLGIAIPMMEHLAVKLLNSRFQRDLTDSTVLRNLGSLFGYFLIGIRNSIKGLGKLDINSAQILLDLEENMELLAEPVQTAMRVYGEENPYEKLKSLTRGRKITKESLAAFIDSLEKVPAEAKLSMKNLTPETYTGVAEKLVDRYFSEYY